MTALPDGGFVVAWDSLDQDGSGWGVYGQRFPPESVIRRGTDGNDTHKGGTATDHLEGLAGNDRLKGGAGADMLDGGEGFDRAIYAGSDAGVNVNLVDGTGLGITTRSPATIATTHSKATRATMC